MNLPRAANLKQTGPQRFEMRDRAGEEWVIGKHPKIPLSVAFYRKTDLRDCGLVDSFQAAIKLIWPP